MPAAAWQQPGLAEALVQSQRPVLAAYKATAAAAAAATPSNLLLAAAHGTATHEAAAGAAGAAAGGGAGEAEPGSAAYQPSLAPPPSTDLVRLMASVGLCQAAAEEQDHLLFAIGAGCTTACGQQQSSIIEARVSPAQHRRKQGAPPGEQRRCAAAGQHCGCIARRRC